MQHDSKESAERERKPTGKKELIEIFSNIFARQVATHRRNRLASEKTIQLKSKEPQLITINNYTNNKRFATKNSVWR